MRESTKHILLDTQSEESQISMFGHKQSGNIATSAAFMLAATAAGTVIGKIAVGAAISFIATGDASNASEIFSQLPKAEALSYLGAAMGGGVGLMAWAKSHTENNQPNIEEQDDMLGNHFR